MLVIGPFVDKWVSGAWIGGYQWHTVAIYYLVASCVVAVAVNISQFMCLGRFSAVTFQVRRGQRLASQHCYTGP